MSIVTERYSRSQADFAAAQEVIPGGVNSPVRAFRGLAVHPYSLSGVKARTFGTLMAIAISTMCSRGGRCCSAMLIRW